MSEVNFPQTVDPETGHIEIIGNGRIAVMGMLGVDKLVTIPESDELIDVAVAAGDLTYGA